MRAIHVDDTLDENAQCSSHLSKVHFICFVVVIILSVFNCQVKNLSGWQLVRKWYLIYTETHADIYFFNMVGRYLKQDTQGQGRIQGRVSCLSPAGGKGKDSHTS